MTEDRSRAALMKFLDYMSNKGLAPASTISARKAAASKILSILSDEEAKDISNIDLAHLMSRFNNLNGHDYTPASLTTYQSRLKLSIEDFFSYQANTLGFKPTGKIREKSAKVQPNKGATNSSTPEASGTQHITEIPEQSPPATVSSLNLPIPLRANLTVQIQGLPYDLTKSEATKIAAVIMAFSNT